MKTFMNLEFFLAIISIYLNIIICELLKKK